MKNLEATMIAALLTIPAACSHDERPAASPEHRNAGAAGAYEVAPAPNTTSEPNDVVSPGERDNADPQPSEGLRQVNPSGAASPMSDSRTTLTPFRVAQPIGGSSAGGYGGLGGFGTGGTIVTQN
jgi:hypothetical protein